MDEVDFIYEEDHLYAIEVKSGRRRTGKGLAAFQKRFPEAILVIITPENIAQLEADAPAFLKLMR